MTEINNILRLKQTRRELRNNATGAEKIFWEHLKGKKVLNLKFRRQHSVGRYVLDFYCATLKLGIELDGAVHNDRKEYDGIRTEFLEAYGIRIIRYKNQEVINNVEEVLKHLQQYIEKNYGKY